MFESIKNLFGGGKRADGYKEHMQPHGRRARARQIDKSPRFKHRLTLDEMAELYRNPFMRRIVDLKANGAACGAPQFSGSDNQFWTDKFTSRKLSLIPALQGGLRWGITFGLGGCIMDWNDRQPLDRPLRIKQASELLSITPLDRRVMVPLDAAAGPESEYFRLFNMAGTVGTVHRSRLLIFDGLDTDYYNRIRNMGCGESEVDLLAGSIAGVYGGYESMEFILQVFATFLYSIEDLDSLMANSPEQISAKFEAMDDFRHLSRMLAIDSKDKIDYKSMPLNGVPELFSPLLSRVSIETGIPETILLGRSPSGSGLSNGGRSEREQFESLIAAHRTARLDSQLEYLLELMAIVYRKELPGWKMPPALPPDMSTELKNRQIQAQIDGAYKSMAVYGTRTIQQRFEGDYSFETRIHPDELNDMDELVGDPDELDKDEENPDKQTQPPQQGDEQ